MCLSLFVANDFLMNHCVFFAQTFFAGGKFADVRLPLVDAPKFVRAKKSEKVRMLFQCALFFSISLSLRLPYLKISERRRRNFLNVTGRYFLLFVFFNSGSVLPDLQY